MTTDQALVLAWLLVAHLVADFILQREWMVVDKFAGGRRGWRGLLGHGAGVALALAPVVLVYGLRGATFLVVIALAHVVIDRWKVRATRHAEAVALAAAHRAHAPSGSETGLGPAWTPMPGALFIADQLAHVAVIVVAWVLILWRAEPTAEYLRLAEGALGGTDRSFVHAATLIGVVTAAVVLVNVRAAALFVATLVNPRQSITGTPADEPHGPTTGRPTTWRLRVGPFLAVAEPAPRPVAAPPRESAAREGHASPERIGATIGILERLLIVTFVVTNATAAIGFVVAAKTLARFKQLDDRDFAEYYLLGTLASVLVAIVTGLLASAALSTLP